MLLKEAINTYELSDSTIKNVVYKEIPKISELPQLYKKFEIYSGKVREMLSSENYVYMVHTDRLSAFDRHIGCVPCKGIILSKISEFWFKHLSKIVPTHYISTENERTLKVLNLKPIKAEVIVRGYLAGSMLKSYQKGERLFCGVHLPEGLLPYQKLPQPIITPTTKADTYDHDMPASPAELVQSHVLTDSEWKTIESMALKIFKEGTKVFNQINWTLVDTKYEFGKDAEGKIYLIDEVHTPDSSRFWQTGSQDLKEGPVMFDKEIIRRELVKLGFSGEGDVPNLERKHFVRLAKTYLEVAKKLTNKELSFNEIEPCSTLLQ